MATLTDPACHYHDNRHQENEPAETTPITARGAFEAVKSGRVGIAGPTAAVVDQSLSGARDFVDRLLVKVYATRRSTEPVIREERRQLAGSLQGVSGSTRHLRRQESPARASVSCAPDS